MNIQIFGKSKCFDTKKAERFFKERGIKYQYIDLLRYGISPGELRSVITAVSGMANVAVDDPLLRYLDPVSAFTKLLDDPELLRTPIVRFGKKATVGCAPEIWKEWLSEL